MKRAGSLFPKITKRENLRLAYYRAVRGKRDRSDAREFALQLDENLARLADRLQSGTAVVGLEQARPRQSFARATAGALAEGRDPEDRARVHE